MRENGLGYTVCLFLKKAIKEVFGIINKAFRSLSKKLELGFIEIIKVRTYIKDERFGRVLFVFFLGKQIYPTKRKHQTNVWVDPDQPVMYFKINRMSDYAKPCVQHWVNIAKEMKADYYFVCDNTQLQYHLLRTVNFPGSDIKFMKSKRKKLKGICKAFATPRWRNAAYAHVTPFYHAREIGIDRFWAIDADDTMICLQDNRVSEALRMAQKVASQKNLTAFSIDMWRSRTSGRYWTWGVAYITENVDFWNLFSTNKDLQWFAPYQDLDVDVTFDWYFTYLCDSGKAKMETFYIDNTYFIHWGSFLRVPHGAHPFCWSEGKVLFPIFKYVYNYERLGTIDIADCIKLDIGATRDEGTSFFEHEVAATKTTPDKIRTLLNLGDFSTMKKSTEKL